MMLSKSAAATAPGERPKILVIRRDNIGDLVCTTPVFAALRARFPQAWIAALVNRYSAPVLEHNTDLDAVFSYRKAKHRARGEWALGLYWERLRLLLALRRRSIDYAILASPGYQASAERLARLVKPLHTVGFDNGSKLADLRVPARTDRPLHQVQNTFRLLGALGIEGPPPPLKLAPDPRLVEHCRKQLPASGEIVVGVHISAREADRRWSDANFIELIRALVADRRVAVLLTWSPGARDNPLFPGDDDSAKRIAAAGAGERLVALPTPELSQLIASLAVCDCVVCSDGAAVHLGSALGKPIVCLFGSESPQRWHPWGVPYRLLQPASRDVRDIGVDEVRQAFAALLAEIRIDRPGTAAGRS